jgi:hypothetical protein
MLARNFLRRDSGLLVPHRKLYAPSIIHSLKEPLLAAFVITSEGAATGTSPTTLNSSSFNPGAGGLVWVLVADASSGGGLSAPTDNLANSYSPASGNDPGLAGNGQSYYHYYSTSPGTITVSYSSANQSLGDTVGMSVVVITGSNGVYDSAGSSANLNNGTTISITSNVAAVSGELAIGSAFAFTTFTGVQSLGWTTPPTAFTSTNATMIAGNQTLSGTGAVTYSPTLTGVGFSTTNYGFIDLFEPLALTVNYFDVEDSSVIIARDRHSIRRMVS